MDVRELLEKYRNSTFISEQLSGFNLTKTIINQELSGIYNTKTLRDMKSVLLMYAVYEQGAEYDSDASSGDWVPADWHCKQIRSLINREARFMFASSPDIRIKDNQKEVAGAQKRRIQPNEDLIVKVLDQNRFNSKLVRAAKDCLIGKRLAIVVNFNETSGVDIIFVPSLEFIYETDAQDVDRITKFIQFYTFVDSEDKKNQRIYKKKWFIADDGLCHVTEEIYDGSGNLIETVIEDLTTRFSYIPAIVIINDGLVNDPYGVSDVEALIEDETWYSKLSSKDIDSLRKGTDQITWARDIDPRSTKGLSRAPGAFWDLQTDPAAGDGKTGEVGTLDNPMSYSDALAKTLQRLKTSMHAAVDVPDTSNEALQGLITSGKTFQAVYWGLMVRCDEKMLDWVPALRFMTETIIEGCRLYPEIYRLYGTEQLVEDYRVIVENNYPILQDENEEKSNDMAEVTAKVRSRKSYMRKWHNLTEEEVDTELKQIQLEQAMLEQENYFSEGNTEEGEE